MYKAKPTFKYLEFQPQLKTQWEYVVGLGSNFFFINSFIAFIVTYFRFYKQIWDILAVNCVM